MKQQTPPTSTETILPNYDLDGIKWGAGYVHAWINGKLVRQHRYVMEKHLGRKLRADEYIHHINNIPYDNRIENLQIVSRHEHSVIHNKGNKNMLGKKLTLSPQERERRRQDALNKRRTHPSWSKPKLGIRGKNNRLSKPVYQYDLSGNLIKEWESVLQTTEGGFKQSCVSRSANKPGNTHKGFIWKFVHDWSQAGLKE